MFQGSSVQLTINLRTVFQGSFGPRRTKTIDIFAMRVVCVKQFATTLIYQKVFQYPSGYFIMYHDVRRHEKKNPERRTQQF